MSRKLLVLALLGMFLMPASVVAQSDENDSEKIEQLGKEQYNQLKRIVYLESLSRDIRQSISVLESSNVELSDDVQAALERLAQSETAINATLETFQQKFEDQNATIDEVSTMLEKRLGEMMMYILLGIALVVILVLITVRRVADDAAKRQEASWNAFQTHIFKSK